MLKKTIGLILSFPIHFFIKDNKKSIWVQMDLIFSKICYKKLNVMLFYLTSSVLLSLSNKFVLELSFDNQTFVTLYFPFSFGSLP